MQFPELNWVDPQEKCVFEKFPGTRHMLYGVNDNANMQINAKYPEMAKLFAENNEVCRKYLSRVSQIVCTHISGGRKFLANKDGVDEQNVHTDYDPNGLE